ncbi:putative alpha/beta superfamily hydrolase [Pelomonas aquatica]|uniref:Alpha/beta superfamily hydrolase n=1 Tax=Pelomonas aquatica TaxID=431058 RepID=A0ABU1Z9D2_9BURK|nr:alpha/beta hydrolase-fold protein [Pelomonas aquatica]MDR7297212.1 putative alpha/beta superfamily hydrolase [Pelomonas aquatica]
MKRFVLNLTFLLSALPAASAWAADAVPAYPPHAIGNSLLRALPKNADGRSYQLHIHLPASYAKEPKRRYPVLYVTDGYWDFPTVVSSYNNLNYDKVVPEFITVGLGYAGEGLDYGQLRAWELSPVRMNPLASDTGHADKFLAALEREIFPLMERDYRADPAQRYLAGSSLGGLFTLHAMYAKPQLFKGYIAASPAVVAGNDWIIGQAKAYAATGKPIKARLYVTGAEYEWPGFLAGIQRYQALLPELKHPELVFQNRTIDGERHAGTKAESYTRGMRFVFEPLAPETGKSKD